jgi:hypothetical protein
MHGSIIYNVTVKLEHAIANDWLQWLKAEHIPDITGTGCFTHAVVLRLKDVDESDGPTFAVQYYATSKANYDRYIVQYAEEMSQRAYSKWGDKFLAFRSLLEVVD